ncbi:MAG: hypothetical protein ACRD5L_09840 [Bryobacteraceae bacterium]
MARAVILLCLVTLLYLFWPIYQVAGQVAALIVIVLGLRYAPPMARWFVALPIPHRAVFLLLLGGMIAGHFAFDTRTYFPFVTWEIFPQVSEKDPVTCREFMATTASGKSVRLLVEQLFPSIIQFDPPADNNSAAMTDLVNALAAEYSRQHPADPARRVDLIQMAVKLDGESPSCQLLKRYEISSGPSR